MTEEEALGAGEPTVVRHYRWAEQSARMSGAALHEADQEGQRRRATPQVLLSRARTGMIEIDPGQSSPPHVKDAEVAVLQLVGGVTFVVDGVAFDLEPFDFLTIPRGATYSYANGGRHPAIFSGTIVATNAWPDTNVWLPEGAGEEHDREGGDDGTARPASPR